MIINKVRAAFSKLIQYVVYQTVLATARIRMRLGIKAVTEIHKMSARQYIPREKDNKRILNYIVLLDRPIIRRKYFVENWKLKYRNSVKIEERLFWINRFNFKRIRRAGWLPSKMHLNDLKQKAFYVSSVLRSYPKEFAARENAMNKYISYLQETHKAK